MTNTNCRCQGDCIGLSIVASIIIGIITAFLTFSAAITITPAFLWVVLGIAVVYLAITFIVTSFLGETRIRDCVCRILSALLIGILGAALVAVILLAITFAATSVLGAIISGALVGFLALILTSTACLVKCLARCDD